MSLSCQCSHYSQYTVRMFGKSGRKKKTLNLYTNKTSQLIKKIKKIKTSSVYICGRKSVFTVQLYFSVVTHLQENQHHLEIL